MLSPSLTCQGRASRNLRPIPLKIFLVIKLLSSPSGSSGSILTLKRVSIRLGWLMILKKFAKSVHSWPTSGGKFSTISVPKGTSACDEDLFFTFPLKVVSCSLKYYCIMVPLVFPFSDSFSFNYKPKLANTQSN